MSVHFSARDKDEQITLVVIFGIALALFVRSQCLFHLFQVLRQAVKLTCHKARYTALVIKDFLDIYGLWRRERFTNGIEGVVQRDRVVSCGLKHFLQHARKSRIDITL